MSKHGTFYWSELLTPDVEAAKAFYGTTVGWTFQPMNDGETYWIAMAGGVPVAGIGPLADFAPPGVPPHWLTYLAVDDVDARVAGFVAAGGIVVKPCFDIPGVGRIAIVRDPQGATMGWMTPA
jgi:predicted enzyme related to lactoylglutathione lyase